MNFPIALALTTLIWSFPSGAESTVSSSTYNRADINVVGNEAEAIAIRQKPVFSGATRSTVPLDSRINLKPSNRSGYIEVYNAAQREWVEKFVGEPAQEPQDAALFSEIVSLAGCGTGWSKVVLQLTNSTAQAKVYVNSGFVDKIGKAGDLDKDIGGFCKDKPLTLELKKLKCKESSSSISLSENPHYVKEKIRLKCK